VHSSPRLAMASIGWQDGKPGTRVSPVRERCDFGRSPPTIDGARRRSDDG
jgi:hypothetical protein